MSFLPVLNQSHVRLNCLSAMIQCLSQQNSVSRLISRRNQAIFAWTAYQQRYSVPHNKIAPVGLSTIETISQTGSKSQLRLICWNRRINYAISINRCIDDRNARGSFARQLDVFHAWSVCSTIIASIVTFWKVLDDKDISSQLHKMLSRSKKKKKNLRFSKYQLPNSNSSCLQ